MRKVIKITPLQDLLLRKVIPGATVMQAVRRGRVQVWRWAKGISYPEHDLVPVLIVLYQKAGHGLDHNGCYVPSVELSPEEASRYGF